MNKILFVFTLAVIGLQFAFGQGKPDSKTERELLKINRDYDAALVTGDVGALERIFAAEFIYTSPGGEVRNKAQQLDSMRASDLKFESGTSDDIQVRLYGNTAVMTGRFTAKARLKGEKFDFVERYTAVWIRKNNAWKLVAEQGTFIKTDSAAAPQNPAASYYVAEERKALNRPYSDAVRVGNTLYLSGAIGTLPGTNQLAAGGIEAETRQTLENIRRTLEANNSSMNQVVRCTVMLADISEWDKMNAVYRTFFPNNRPARSSLGVSGLVQNARVEIECTAVIEPK